MPTINGKVCVVNGTPVDKVYSNGVQVYGRNLLINSSSSASNGRTKMRGSTTSEYAGVYSRTDSYEEVIATSNYNECFYRFINPKPNNLSELTLGETYTLSGSISHTVGKLVFRAEYYVQKSWIPLGGNSYDLGNPVSDGSVFTPFSYTFTVPNSATGVYFSLQNSGYTVGSRFRFKNMKLEKGRVATPWTPAPEDVGVITQ